MQILSPLSQSPPFESSGPTAPGFPLLYGDWFFLGSTLASAPLPDDLLDAVYARITANLVATGALTWFGTSAAQGKVQGRTLQLPYAKVGEPDEDDSYWTTDGDGLADGHLEIAAYAATKKAARVLGDSIAASLQDAPLAFKAGILIYLRQTSRAAELDPDPGPDGGDCWSETRQFRFMYSFNIGG